MSKSNKKNKGKKLADSPVKNAPESLATQAEEVEEEREP